jgi:SSS family solute:Na+ symporter
MPLLLARAAAAVGPRASTIMLAALGLAALGSGAAIVRAMSAALGAVAPRPWRSLHRVLPVLALTIAAMLTARGQGIIDTMVSVNVVYIASVAVPFVALLSRRGVPVSCVPASMAAGFGASSMAYAAGWLGLIEVSVETASLCAGLAASILAAAACFVHERTRAPTFTARNV